MRLVPFLSSILVVFWSVPAFTSAVPSNFTYQGRLLDSGGAAITSSSVNFKIQILSQDANCLLFEETHTKDLSSSNGFFSLSIGSGTNTGATSLSLIQVFDNTGTAKSGQSCNYTPSSGDYRQLKLSYTISGSEVTLTPNHIILSTPNALVAQTLQGKTPDGFVQVNGNITQSKVDDLTSKHTELMALANGTSNTYTKANELNGSSLPSVSNGQSVRWNTSLNSGAGGWESFTPGTATAVNSVNVAAPIVDTGTANDPVIGISAATSGAAGSMSAADKSKLDAIESGATADQSAAEILTALLTVDGATSGLDADLLDGQSGAYYLDYGNFTNKPTIPDGFSLDASDGDPANALSVDATGQVGIGNTSPSQKLQVDDGNILIRHSTSYGILEMESYSSNGGHFPILRFNDSHSGVMGTKTSAGAGNYIGAIVFNGVTSGGGFDNGALIYALQTGATNTRVPTALIFHTSDGTADGPERMRIHSNGNVGIGTNNPSVKLEVTGNQKITGDLEVTGTITGARNGCYYSRTFQTEPAEQHQASRFCTGTDVAISAGAVCTGEEHSHNAVITPNYTGTAASPTSYGFAFYNLNTSCPADAWRFELLCCPK